MSVGAVEAALLEAAQLERDDDVLVFGGGALVFAAHARVGDGWVYAVRSQVEELEELLREAHGAGTTGVAYLVGEAPVLPLPDASVSAVVGRIAVDDGSLAAAAAELARVLRPGGRVGLAEPRKREAGLLADALCGVGCQSVRLVDTGEAVVVAAQLE